MMAAACAATVLGCNVSPETLQQAVQEAATLLKDAGVKLEFLDADGQAVVLAEEDIDAVYLDGKELSAADYDVVEGEVRFKGLEADDRTRKVEIRLKDIEQPLTTTLVAKDGRQKPAENRLAIVQDSLGGVVFQPNGDLVKLREEQRRKDVLSRVTLDIRYMGLLRPPLHAGFFTQEGSWSHFPRPEQPAATWSAKVVAFDVQVFNLLAPKQPPTASPSADPARLPGAGLWVLAERPDGKAVIYSVRFTKADGLKLYQQEPPMPQTLTWANLATNSPEVFDSVLAATAAKRIREVPAPPQPN